MFSRENESYVGQKLKPTYKKKKTTTLYGEDKNDGKIKFFIEVCQGDKTKREERKYSVMLPSLHINCYTIT